jgi:hypothetical protein
VAAAELSHTDRAALIDSGKAVERALRGVLSERANMAHTRGADDVFDSLFTVAGYVSLMHAAPDAYVAEGIRRSVPKAAGPTTKVAAALLAAQISPPLIGWTNALTKMLGEAVAAGRRKSLATALDHAVKHADDLLRQLDHHPKSPTIRAAHTPDLPTRTPTFDNRLFSVSSEPDKPDVKYNVDDLDPWDPPEWSARPGPSPLVSQDIEPEDIDMDPPTSPGRGGFDL